MPNPTGPASFQFSQLARDLHAMGPEIRRQLRDRLTAIGSPLLADARSRAGWSTRIPAAIAVKPLLSEARSTVGVELRVTVGPNAPHARAYEGSGQAGTFRHPVFGRDRWVPQSTRPYAWPAVLAKRADAERLTADAVEAAARAASFR